jgi:NAD(P)-dependent dehydrogenase (short-subunit alcohol dehydrogenase family)
MFQLDNKIIVITGGQQGIGKSIALMCAKQGAFVVVSDLDKNTCDAVVSEIESLYGEGRASSYVLDVTKGDMIDRVVADVMQKHGKIDVLVNNAGVYVPKNVFDIAEDDWDRTLDINLKGQFFCAQRVAREMKDSGGGRIINIASIASGGVGVGVPMSVHYTASKGGVVGMTEALAIDLAEFGILVNCVAPGGVDTPMANPTGKDRSEMDTIMQRSVLKRIGAPEEIASAVIYFASDESSYTTGSTLYVDGGWLAS